MKILVTGAGGYIGYPLVVELRENTKHKVIGVDNGFRSDWVEMCGGDNSCRCADIHGDLTNRDFVNELLAIHRPDVIIHLASQPSMPYSQINGERALFTQYNNLSMLVNLIWGAKSNGLNPKFVVTTTTGIPGQTLNYIPEAPTLNRAGSWYHVTRGFDSDNLSLACRQFGYNALELRTSIVYGIQTDTMARLGIQTRFDTDKYFGTALNRFVRMAIDGKPITVYGKGEQTKPFISLGDTVHSLVRAIDYNCVDHEIMNQVTANISIRQLANLVADSTGGQVAYIPNPRQEKEDFKMTFENTKFLALLDKMPDSIEFQIKKLVEALGKPTGYYGTTTFGPNMEGWTDATEDNT